MHTATDNDVLALASGYGRPSASSEWSPEHRAERGLLNYQAREGGSAWSAGFNDRNQWFQISTSNRHTVFKEIRLQGRGNYDTWVTEFTVQVTSNGIDWTAVNQGRPYKGCTDRNSINIIPLYPAPTGLSIRICPITWHTHIALRADALIIIPDNN